MVTPESRNDSKNMSRSSGHHSHELTSPEGVRVWLASQNHSKQLVLLEKFENDLSARHQSRLVLSLRTVELLRNIVGSTRWKNAAQLLILLRGLGRELQALQEPAIIGNVVRRVMCAVRDEVHSEPLQETSSQGSGVSTATAAGGKGLSLSTMLWAHPQHVSTRQKSRASSSLSSNPKKKRSDSFSNADPPSARTNLERVPSVDNNNYFPPIYYLPRPDLRAVIMEAIQEFSNDLQDLHVSINEQCTNHIQTGEVILVYAARSKTVESFLKAGAKKKRTFQVIVCEGAPNFGGHDMAKSLAESGIETTVIHDAAIFAIMSRVNKVLLPAHAVLANGGLVAPSGSNMVAQAAKHNSVPVVSITGLFKLCPMYPHEGQDTLNDLTNPSSVLSHGECHGVEVLNPVHDYIPPQLITLYVTNIGAFQPSYIYRLLAEYYHSEDWEAFD